VSLLRSSILAAGCPFELDPEREPEPSVHRHCRRRSVELLAAQLHVHQNYMGRAGCIGRLNGSKERPPKSAFVKAEVSQRILYGNRHHCLSADLEADLTRLVDRQVSGQIPAVCLDCTFPDTNKSIGWSEWLGLDNQEPPGPMRRASSRWIATTGKPVQRRFATSSCSSRT
jgi:hypothetical protein